MSLKALFKNDSKENEPNNSHDGKIDKTVTLDLDVKKNKEDANQCSPHGSRSFSDTDFGEALHVQRLDIDFTPDEVDENPVLLEKCHEFWKLIRNQPYLMNMAVNNEGQTSSCSATSIETVKNEDVSAKHTDALDWLEYKDAVKRSFATCAKQNCDKKEDYPDSVDPIQKEHGKETSRMADKKGEKDALENPNKSYVKYLCDEMEEWDSTHPKLYKHGACDTDNVAALNDFVEAAALLACSVAREAGPAARVACDGYPPRAALGCSMKLHETSTRGWAPATYARLTCEGPYKHECMQYWKKKYQL